MNQTYVDDTMFETLFECSPDACLLIENNCFIKCNQAAVTMLHATSKEQIFNTHPSVVSPEIQPDGRNSFEKAEEMMANVIDTGSLHFEWLHKRMDGEVFPVDVSLTLIRDGERVLIYTVWRDISDRKQAEEALLVLKDTLQEQNEELQMNEESLREQNDQLLATEELLRVQIGEYEAGQKLLQESEGQYRKLSSEQQIILNCSSVGIIFVKNRKAIWANPAHCKIFGYEVGTTQNMDTAVFYVDKESYEDIGRKAYSTIASGGIYSEDLIMKKQDGTQFWCNLVGQAVSPHNPEEGSIWSILDITDRKRAEEERMQLEGQLRQSQKMEIVGTLAGGLSHDFNNVLGGIMGTASLLRMQIKSGKELSNEHLCTKIDNVIDLSSRAADIVAQLMVISRKQETALAPVDLRLAIKRVVDICRNTFDKSVAFTINIPDFPIVINADSGQIEQVLLNLCVNAGHAMTTMRKKGDVRGGTLNVTTERLLSDRHFCLSHPGAKERTEYWQLSVRDTGIGMDTQTVSRIFDPFFTTKEKGMGTGLGLSMVYTIVQQHHGFIDVYSEPGTGTTFNIYLPMRAGDGISVPINDPDSITMGEGLILVVEDEPFIRETAQAMLEECGYQVLLAANGEEAVTIYREQSAGITAVVMDMIMPKKSGMDAYLEIRQIRPDVKVLFASGFMQDERITTCAEMGVMAFIKKPYSMHTFTKAVANVIADEKLERSR